MFSDVMRILIGNSLQPSVAWKPGRLEIVKGIRNLLCKFRNVHNSPS